MRVVAWSTIMVGETWRYSRAPIIWRAALVHTIRPQMPVASARSSRTQPAALTGPASRAASLSDWCS
jgi:anaerobic C4-dicarboxylate transporter